MVNLTINGRPVQVEEGTTILQAAKKIGIDIPTLCFLKDVNEVGDCRMCIVEVEGMRGLTTACITKVTEKNVTLDILDTWDNIVISDLEIEGKKISDDINVGTVIELKN